MKNKLLLLSSFLLVFLASCKKDDQMVTYQGGTTPVLTANFAGTSPYVLDKSKETTTAVTFSWTNPDYKFSTGVSSHDVTYTLQVDTAGSNFTNPDMQQLIVARDLSTTLTVKDLNALLSKMNLLENIPHNMEFRLKSTLENNSVPLFSNVIKITIVPYLDAAIPLPPTGDLFITGDATPSGWTNTPPASQKVTQKDKTTYEIVMSFTPGFYYKFLSNQGQWQPQYGGSSATGGDLGFNMGLPGQSDPAAIPTPSAAGNYKVVLNFKTGKYTVTPQ